MERAEASYIRAGGPGQKEKHPRVLILGQFMKATGRRTQNHGMLANTGCNDVNELTNRCPILLVGDGRPGVPATRGIKFCAHLS
jgi:hypothetical protein